MTEELASMKRMIENTGRAKILLERNDFLLAHWNNSDVSSRYCLHAYPYGKSGMANNLPWEYEITDEQADFFLANPDKAEDFFKSKHWYFHDTEIKVYNFDDITQINENGINFKDGHWFRFAECVHLWHRDHPQSESMCIGKRDIAAEPIYIEFWSFYHHDKVIFDKNGMFSKKKNIEDFHKLCQIINDYGYTTYDLS